MYPTIIFFFALFSSIILVEATAIDISTKTNNYHTIRVIFTTLVITFWSWLYYLSH